MVFRVIATILGGFFGAVACVRLFTGKTNAEAVETVRNFINPDAPEVTFDVYSDPEFIAGMKEVVRQYSAISPELSTDGSGFHCDLPYYVVQLQFKNEDDKKIVGQIAKKLVNDALLRNGFQRSDVLVDFPDFYGFPAIEIRYACTKEQFRAIQRALLLDKTNAANSVGGVRDAELDKELDQLGADDDEDDYSRGV